MLAGVEDAGEVFGSFESHLEGWLRAGDIHLASLHCFNACCVVTVAFDRVLAPDDNSAGVGVADVVSVYRDGATHWHWKYRDMDGIRADSCDAVVEGKCDCHVQEEEEGRDDHADALAEGCWIFEGDPDDGGEDRYHDSGYDANEWVGPAAANAELHCTSLATRSLAHGWLLPDFGNMGRELSGAVEVCAELAGDLAGYFGGGTSEFGSEALLCGGPENVAFLVDDADGGYGFVLTLQM